MGVIGLSSSFLREIYGGRLLSVICKYLPEIDLTLCWTKKRFCEVVGEIRIWARGDQYTEA